MKSRYPNIKVWSLTLLVGLSVFAYSLYHLSRNTEYQLFGELVFQVNTDQKVVALTFDDGPTHKGTEPTIETLKRHDVKATFFLTGNAIKARPEIALKLIEAGHEIGNHSLSHKRMVFMSYGAIEKELETTNSLIRELGFKGDIHFRPPYGKKLLMLPYYLKEQGITTFMWDVAPESYSTPIDTADDIVRKTLEAVKPGSIILLHANYGQGATHQALPEIITRLKKRGYSFTTVSGSLELSTKSIPKD